MVCESERFYRDWTRNNLFCTASLSLPFESRTSREEDLRPNRVYDFCEHKPTKDLSSSPTQFSDYSEDEYQAGKPHGIISFLVGNSTFRPGRDEPDSSMEFPGRAA